MKKLFIIFCLIYFNNSQECDINENNARFDCYPEDGANELDCTMRGCCWNKPISNQNNINIPYCYFPRNFSSFEVVNQFKTNNSLILSIEKQSSTYRKNEILKLEVRLDLDSNDRLHFKIVDPNSERYEVPLVKLNNYNNNNNKDHVTNFKDTDYQIYIENKPFSLKVFRKSTGRILFDTSIAPLIFADQYIQFSTSLVNKYFYGLGEHRDYLAHDTDWNYYTMWNRDYPPSKYFFVQFCLFFKINKQIEK